MDNREALPVPGGALEHERPGWLPATDLPWLEALREQHLAAVQVWLKDVAAVVELRATLDEAARTWRRTLRDAVAVGKEPPPGIDDAIGQAQLEVAQEDAVAARDALAEVVVTALGELRRPERRAELEPHFAGCSLALRAALREGPGGTVAHASALLRAQLERFEGEPQVVNLEDASQAHFTRVGEQEVIQHAST